jgi:hypothetical protein
MSTKSQNYDKDYSSEDYSRMIIKGWRHAPPSMCSLASPEKEKSMVFDVLIV